MATLYEGLARPVGGLCARCRRPAQIELGGVGRCVACHVTALRTDAPPILAPAAPQPAAFKPPPIVRPRTQHGGIVMWRGQGVRLSSTRYRLVSYLHARRHLCSTEDIAEHLWRVVDDGTKANVRVVICQTRALLPGLIDSVPGWGYRLTTSRLEGMR